MLTKREILKQLKSEAVYLGKDPQRTFDLYEGKGLLPSPQGFRKDEALYPENTPGIIKNILFAQQVEKRTVDEIRREIYSGEEIRVEALKRLGLEDEPLNVIYKHGYHGKFGSKDADVLVIIFRTRIVVFLVEGLWGGFFYSPQSEPKVLRVLKRVILTLDQYGEFVKHQAIGRITGEGKILEDTRLFETLFG